MKYENAVIITGPTTVGKTEIAIRLARRLGGEIINCDEPFLYSFFKIGSARSSSFEDSGVARHLYGIVGYDDFLADEQYVEMVESLVPEILSRGRLPIIEGCSYPHVAALTKCNERRGRSFYYSPAIGLRLSANVNLLEKIRRRLDHMIEEGLLDEIRSALENGLKESYAYGIIGIYKPLIRYVDGEMSIEEAKEEVLKTGINISQMQLKDFEKMADLVWVESTPGKTDETVDVLEELLHKDIKNIK